MNYIYSVELFSTKLFTNNLNLLNYEDNRIKHRNYFCIRFNSYCRCCSSIFCYHTRYNVKTIERVIGLTRLNQITNLLI